MMYEALSEEIRAQLEASKIAAIRYSSSIDEPADKVDDAILLSVDSAISPEALGGYVPGPIKVWFEFATSG